MANLRPAGDLWLMRRPQRSYWSKVELDESRMQCPNVDLLYLLCHVIEKRHSRSPSNRGY
ncbi:hypothetical protein Tcan_04521 [Toxocara canis]|uniref:Uncharacterized protein n=1 Tax=Toxocara canis TaxID=6265 RepID=A0A0B2VB91_TOXCA|nr:hypothetical protein Tcan_04521 [Toxocara canis]